MVALKANLLEFADDEAGATAIEYGLIAGLIAVAIIMALGVFGGGLFAIFDYVRGQGGSAMSNAGV